MPGGHVFVVHSDLTRLACDAWLPPWDTRQHVADGWLRHAPEHIRQAQDEDGYLRLNLPGDGDGKNRARRFDAWTAEQPGPQPWLVDMGGVPGTEVSWYLDGLRAFLHAASSDIGDRPARHGRARPLLAVPLVGTGYGGAKEISGAVVRAVLEVLEDFVADAGADVVLVLNSSPAFAAVQAERRRRGAVGWPILDKELRCHADDLAALARRRQLVLFVGAGAGVGAGLPLWDELLTWLGDRVGLAATEAQGLRRLDILDQARIVARRLPGGQRSLGPLIAECFAGKRHHSLVHALLAGLPVGEVATMNYDTLFEQASLAAGRPVSVVPHGGDPSADRWLLKMHGSVTHPDEIVLTRDDYLRYSATRQALAGIVQAMLMTRRMLFVGFSLSDDNFHRIADDVRQVVRGGDGDTPGVFATSLVLESDPLLEELWAEDVAYVSMGAPGADIGSSARRLEAFLDYLLAQSTSATAHLLDPSFEAVLTAEEREVRDALMTFRSSLSREVLASPVWDELSPVLAAFGDGSQAAPCDRS